MKVISENQYIHVQKNKKKSDDAKDLIKRIDAVILTEDVVFDTYPQIVAKLKEFLERDGVTREMMSKVLGISSASLLKFLSEEYMKSIGDKTNKLVYLFLEKLRILEEKDKSEHRLKNEKENPTGCHYYHDATRAKAVTTAGCKSRQNGTTKKECSEVGCT